MAPKWMTYRMSTALPTHRPKWKLANYALRKKCPNTKFFLVCIFSHSDWIRRDTEHLSVFSPNAGKYGAEKTLYLNTFRAVTEQSHAMMNSVSSYKVWANVKKTSTDFRIIILNMEYIIPNMLALIPCQEPSFSGSRRNFWITKTTSFLCILTQPFY